MSRHTLEGMLDEARLAASPAAEIVPRLPERTPRPLARGVPTPDLTGSPAIDASDGCLRPV